MLYRFSAKRRKLLDEPRLASTGPGGCCYNRNSAPEQEPQQVRCVAAMQPAQCSRQHFLVACPTHPLVSCITRRSALTCISFYAALCLDATRGSQPRVGCLDLGRTAPRHFRNRMSRCRDWKSCRCYSYCAFLELKLLLNGLPGLFPSKSRSLRFC